MLKKIILHLLNAIYYVITKIIIMCLLYVCSYIICRIIYFYYYNVCVLISINNNKINISHSLFIVLYFILPSN